MSGGDARPETDPSDDTPVTTASAADDPIVVDLRDGVDTVAVYEAEKARRAAAASQTGTG